MAEPSWETEESSPARKRRIPPWALWGCGGGCLLATLVAIGLSLVAYRFYREGRDPEKQWPRLAEVLPFDERPANLELEFGLPLGFDQFILTDRAQGVWAMVIEFPASADKQYRDLLDPEFDAPLGLGEPVAPEPGVITVQEREVPCLRYAGIESGPSDAAGAGIRVDLTGARGAPRMVELRQRNGTRVPDEVVTAFLEPFDVWRDR